MISRFDDNYFFLSNFFPSNIRYEGLEYKSVEAAFQAAKSLDLEERKRFTDLAPSEAKRLGRSIRLRDDWEDIKYDVMSDLINIKFSQSPYRELLLKTNDNLLIEGNYWHDNIWGNCSCTRCKNIEGKNWLGKILMSQRDKLKEVNK